METQRHGLTRDEISEIVSKGVMDAFVRMGIEANDPTEMQRDFQHLREWRETMESVKKKSVLTVLGVLITGGLGLLWIGLKAVTHGN